MLDVVFLHAYALDSRMWNPQLSAAPLEWGLHALNLPGFGEPATEALSTSMEVIADAIHEETRHLRRFVLCGISMGGYAAFAYWRRYGHEGRLAGLVLADTRADAETAEGKATRDDTVRLLQRQGLPALADRLVPRLLTGKASPEAQASVRELMLAQSTKAVIAATVALRDRPDSTDLLPTMQLPVLLLGGEKDTLTPPPVLQAMAARLPRASYISIPEAGHLANIEQPALFNRALFGFLRSLPPG
jgi:3-oxoadipate enol-lactonase